MSSGTSKRKLNISEIKSTREKSTLSSPKKKETMRLLRLTQARKLRMPRRDREEAFQQKYTESGIKRKTSSPELLRKLPSR